MKENDLILNMLANPQFTITDFQTVGLDSSNTGLQSEDKYLESEKIKSNPAFQTDGEFDKNKFHNFYENAGLVYNQLATNDYDKAVLAQAQYSKDNIFVNPKQRTLDYRPQLVKKANPYLTNNSLEQLGQAGTRTQSIAEIAQTQQIVDPVTGKKSASPNDSFFSNLFNTLVIAQYDEDVKDAQGNIIHEKGELKYNEDGLPYYEYLAGRSVHNKQVLNKMDVLTTDGSIWNKFDFFDSDDLNQKGVGATLLKNATLVGSMFIPYVGPVITGLSVATQTAGLFANLGKLILGSDNVTLNNIEGWAKTVNRQNATEYAQNHTWCAENFLNMIGDTIGQLSEQRWIFKAVPALIKGPKAYKAMSNEGYEALRLKKLQELNEASTKTTEQLIRESLGTKSQAYYNNFAKALNEINNSKATKYVDDIVRQANKIGSPISKAYMTGITVQDTYGQAKEAGATDMEAALLTIGYAAGEAWILNTGLGEWILPELHIDKFKNKAIAEGVLGITKEARATLQATGNKVGFVNKLLSAGKQLASSAQAERTLAGKTLSSIGAHALGESFEETSEEVLADLSKSIFNAAKWLQGEDTLDFWQGDNVLDRYAMSALGGLVGGGINSAATNFRQIKSLSNMNNSQALQQLIYMANNNQLGDFLHAVDKMTLGDKNKSATKIIKSDENGYVFAEGTEEDNQDLMAKQSIRNVVNFIQNTLSASGAKLSTDSLIGKLTLENQAELMKQLKVGNLRNASVLGEYVQNYQNLQAQLIQQNQKLQELKDKMGDVKSKADPQLIQEAENVQKDIEQTTQQLHDYLNGKISPYVIRDTVFQLNPLFNDIFIPASFEQYVKQYKGKDLKDISETEKKNYLQEYNDYNNGVGKDQTKQASELFFNMLKEATPVIQQQLETLKNNTDDQKLVESLNSWINNYLTLLNIPSENIEEFAKKSKELESSEGGALLFKLLEPFYSQDTKARLNEIVNNPEFAEERNNIIFDTLVNNINNLLNPIFNQGYINPELKEGLNQALSIAENIFNEVQQEKIEEATYNRDMPLVKNLTRQLADFNSKANTSRQKLKNLPSTPIISLLNSFGLNATTTPVNITDHWNTTKSKLEDNKEDLSDFGVDDIWEANNEQALKLAKAFRAVLEGMKIDNADINNPTGYSKILNQLFQQYKIEGFTPLAEINTDEANLLLQDINQIIARLTYAQQLAAINRGQKLKEHNRVAVNKNYLIYDSTKRLIDSINDSDWKEVNKLKATFDNIPPEIINALQSKDVKIPKELRKSLDNYILSLDNAIYDFFNANKNSNGDLDINKLASLLVNFAGDNGFFQKTDGILNADTKFLDDNSYIWYLASRAAVKPKDFYGSYLQAINDKIAPISIQEQASYLGVAMIVNSPIINTFIKAYRQGLIQRFKSLSEDKQKELLNNFDGSGDSEIARKLFGGHDVLTQYMNMVFIEGIAGSGKSKAVFANIIGILNGINSDFLKNAFYIHETTESAKNTAKELGLQGKTFSRVDFLKYISNSWKDVRDNRHKNSKGIEHNYLYDDSYEINSQGQLVNKWALNMESNPPKVIFIDEISHYNQQEVSMIEQWARAHGTIVITAGDFDQDTLTSYIDNKAISNEELGVTLNRNNFVRSPKLGVSLRTLNKQLTNSTKTAQLAIQTIREGGDISNLEFTYLENNSEHPGFYGVKVIKPVTDKVQESDLTNNNVEETIQSMISTLNNGEKIGYIYNDENSALYKLLTTKYADKIVKYKDSDAQGLEGQYYIVDTNLNSIDDLAYIKSLYTGITRASQGVLVISQDAVGHVHNITSKADNNFQLESLSREAIKNASQERKDALNEVITDEDRITQIIEPKQESVDSQVNQGTAKPTTGLLVMPPSPTPQPSPINSTTKEQAQNILEAFNREWQGFKAEKDGETFEIIDGYIANINDNYVPYIKLDNNVELPLEEFKNTYNKVKKEDNSVAPIYSVGEQFIYNDGNNDNWVTIKSIDTTNGINYTLEAADGDIIVDEQQLKAGYKGKTPSLPLPTIEFSDNYMENIPEEEYKEAITVSNEEPEPINSFGLLHSFNTYNPGMINDNGKAKFDDNSSEATVRFNARIDGFIGLMHILESQGTPTDDYNYLDKLFSRIRVLLFTEKNNGQLVSDIKDLLNLNNGEISIQYALKSTAGRINSKNPRYYRYDLGDNEQLSYLYSDDDSATEVPRKTIVALIMQDGLPILEIPTCILNSPLTLLNLKNDKGLVFERIHNIFYSNPDYNTAISKIINISNPTSEEKPLIDLFKIFRYTSNGIFFLDKDFNLANNQSSGIHLTGAKGENQLNGRFITQNKFIAINQLLQNPQFKATKVLMSKSGLVEGKSIIRPGHPFILVGDSRYSSQEALIDRFKQQAIDESLDKDVKLYYVLPPRASIQEWLINQHNLGLNTLNHEAHAVYDIGNDLTGYRILSCLGSEIDNIPSVGSSQNYSQDDKVKELVKQLLSKGKTIEDKWKASVLNLDNSNTIEGKGEKDYFDLLMSQYNQDEKTVRQILQLKELAQFLKTVPSNPNLFQAGRSYNQIINAYLACMVYNNIYNNATKQVTIKEAEGVAQRISDICENNGMDGVYYKVQYSKNNAEPFIEIIQTDNYQLKGVNNALLNFEINARIDTPTFFYDKLPLDDIAKNMSYDPQRMVYNMINNSDEKIYLGQVSRPKTTQNEYSEYISKGLLTQKDVDDIQQIVEGLLTANGYYEKYNASDNKALLEEARKTVINYAIAKSINTKNKSTWAFISNGKLIITKNTDYTITNKPDEITLDNFYVEAVDFNGNNVLLFMQPRQDNKGNYAGIDYQVVNYIPITSNQKNKITIKELSKIHEKVASLINDKTAKMSKILGAIKNNSLEQLNEISKIEDELDRDLLFEMALKSINSRIKLSSGDTKSAWEELRDFIENYRDSLSTENNNIANIENGDIILQDNNRYVVNNSENMEATDKNGNTIKIDKNKALKEEIDCKLFKWT